MGRKVIKKKHRKEPNAFKPPVPSTMERFHHSMAKLLEGREFSSVDDLNAFLHEKSGSGALNQLLSSPDDPQTPQEQAQELCWRADEAPSLDEAKRLIRQALALDPECTDALVFQANLAETPEEALPILERAVAASARRLGGEGFFNENAGHFWGLVETRPYMRARATLAEVYSEAGRRLDSIAEYEGLLKLCPNDNQGNRYSLLGQYLRAGEIHRSRLLIEQFDHEESTVFLYGELIAELLAQDFDQAKKILKKARAANRHVFAHLTGAKDDLPGYSGICSPGEESEAAFCMECLGDAFFSSPVITLWMVDQAGSKGGRTLLPF